VRLLLQITLVQQAYRAAGLALPRTADQQARAGTPVPDVQHLRAGDLVFQPGADGTRFSGGPGCEVKIDPGVCPAQAAVPGSAVSATGVVDARLSRLQKCASARVILFAVSQLGKPYRWGAAGPDAFDCSGLSMMAYRSAGVAVPRTSQQQWAAGPYVPPGQERPGDLVYFAGSDGTASAPGHVGVALGGGLMIDAPYTGARVRVEAIVGEVGFTRPAAGR
jgi:cell wall-associated NlpC family hydrolase